MPKVFISHNANDKPFARRLANDLKNHGIEVWIDEAEIKLGDSLIDKISEGITEVDYVAVLLSKHSVSSEWVKREVNVALTHEISGKNVKILPLLLEKCEIPIFLTDRLYADFTAENQYPKGLELILERIFPNKKIDIEITKNESKDVCIVTILDIELQAVLSSIGCTDQPKEDLFINGNKMWFREVQRTNNEPLSAIVIKINQTGSLPLVFAIHEIIQNYSIDLFVMVGLAYGPRALVSLGDVVFAERILEHDEMYSMQNRFSISNMFQRNHRLRPKFYEPPSSILSTTPYFNADIFISKFDEIVKNVDRKKLPRLAARHRPMMHLGTVVGTPNIVTNVNLQKLTKNHDEKIRAVSYEDSAFAEFSCENDLKWCIFRGISDYGDTKKIENWNFVAALSAACAAVTFLEAYKSKRNSWSYKIWPNKANSADAKNRAAD